MRRVALVTIGLCLACADLPGAEPAPREGKLPEGPGLAAKYPRDVGMAGDPRVLFAEDFESGGVEALAQRWDNVSNDAGKVLASRDDVPPASVGKRTLAMTATLGQNPPGHP